MLEGALRHRVAENTLCKRVHSVVTAPGTGLSTRSFIPIRTDSFLQDGHHLTDSHNFYK